MRNKSGGPAYIPSDSEFVDILRECRGLEPLEVATARAAAQRITEEERAARGAKGAITKCLQRVAKMAEVTEPAAHPGGSLLNLWTDRAQLCASVLPRPQLASAPELRRRMPRPLGGGGSGRRRSRK